MKRSTFIFFLLPLFACYVVALETENIIGGEVSNPRQFPYQVSIQLGDSHFCGGALLNEDTVLTAAHCFYHDGSVPRVPYVVVAGTTNLRYSTGQRISVAKIYAHRRFTEYDDGTVSNDITLLKLADKFDIGEGKKINKVDLPKPNEKFTGKPANVSGFGWDNIRLKINWLSRNVQRTGSSDKKLKFLEVQVLKDRECDSHGPGHICARSYEAYSEYQHGVCSGDSGGPLVRNNKIIGIISYGITTCDEAEVPTVYTEVSSYLPFINGVLNGKPTADTLIVNLLRSRRPNQTTESSHQHDYDEIQRVVDELLAIWRAGHSRIRNNSRFPH